MAVDARRITASQPTADPPRAVAARPPSVSGRPVSSQAATHSQGTTTSLPALDSRRTTSPHRAASRPEEAWLGTPLVSVFGAARDRDPTADLQPAIEQLEQITRRDPRDLDAAEALARVLADSERNGRASVELLRLAVLYADLGRVQEALRAVEHARQLEPACLVRARLAPLVSSLGARGRSPCERAVEGHLAAARLGAARDLLALLVETQPGDVDLRHRLAKTELLLGRTPVAIEHLRIVIEGHRSKRHLAKLVPAAEELLRHGGPDVDLLWELTLIYLQADLHERALEKLEQLRELLPSDLEIVERMANLQARLGRVHAALGTLWRLVSAMRRAGSEDHQVRELLERARNWNDTASHRESIDALTRKVMSASRRVPSR